MFRLVGIALLLIARNCVADTYFTEGDGADQLTIPDNIFMDGGHIDRLILWGHGPYDLQGGRVGQIELETGDLDISGGKQGQIIRSQQRSGGKPTAITFSGQYFRVQDAGRDSYNEYRVEGWLADGNFVSLKIYNLLAIDTELLPIEFNLVPSQPPSGDIDNNWVIDLEDLNYVRNNFGSEGVELELLNEVREHFDDGKFTLTSNYYEVGSLPQAVPEPPAWVWIPASLLLLYLFRPRKELE